MTKAMRIASWGHAVFAATMIGLGILGLVKGSFTPTWTGVPNGLLGRHALAYLCAVISLGCGFGLLWSRTAASASRVLFAYLAIWLVLFRVSHFLFTPTAVDTWWGFGDTAVMLAAAWVLYVWFDDGPDKQRFAFAKGENGLRTASIFYGTGLILFGVAHFTNLNDTAPLVPAWLPWHVFWAYFTGAAFIAAGVAIITDVCARLAATLSAWQVGLFTLIVWEPVVARGATPGQWMEFVNSWALTAAAWMVADSYRGTAWLAVRNVRRVVL